jgi:hypothetical protein
MSDDWLDALRRACNESTQAAVARRLGLSPATVSQVLKGVYNADLTAVEQRVRGALMHETVACPVLGEIKKDKCLDHQARPQRFCAVNPLYMRLSRTCPDCPFSKNRTKG